MAVSHNKKTPVGVEFKKDTIFRLGGYGDNWCITWLPDDSQVTSMDDGNWMGISDISMHNHLFRIKGAQNDFMREDIPAYPSFFDGEGGWFGYGIIWSDAMKDKSGQSHSLNYIWNQMSIKIEL